MMPVMRLAQAVLHYIGCKMPAAPRVVQRSILCLSGAHSLEVLVQMPASVCLRDSARMLASKTQHDVQVSAGTSGVSALHVPLCS